MEDDPPHKAVAKPVEDPLIREPELSLRVETLPAPTRILCYADCSLDGALTVADFGCFQTRFAAADPYADCNGDTAFTVADFGCFQTKFVAGCR